MFFDTTQPKHHCLACVELVGEAVIMNRTTKALAILALFLPLVGSSQPSPSSSSSWPPSHARGANRTSTLAHHEMNGGMCYDVWIHGLLLWSSMGFLMPAGILIIRLSARERSKTRLRSLFYAHVIVQVLGLSLATAGAILSIKKFENTFNNLHQRIGLILYVAIWVQALTGLIRPPRGTKKRRTWYIGHWILGITVSFLGILNVYTGITAYQVKVKPIRSPAKTMTKAANSTQVWSILFTAEVSCIAFLYLLVDKWDYIKVCGTKENDGITAHDSSDVNLTIVPEASVNKELVLIQCNKKSNALKNLFEL
ncbi:hypothetical protein MLD38_021209 [Melastoma candidum]|uniref:Uncharacterized protein n=1 Tax=Melastoma candidum TaxID=119954 RepID=A0ACB9QH77_9MYRT|nr:hypothetical protein MLD38_021209 [Melastoma candidum]